MAGPATAVLDVGKTNVKVILFDAEGRVLAERSRPNRSLPGPPYLNLDVAGIWDFLIAALADLGRAHAIAAIVPTTHGATGMLVGDDPDRDHGLVLPALDYEERLVEAIEPIYAALRPPFARTFSPPMGGGLNFGRQLAFLADRFPAAVARAKAVLMYPQYWAWRLSGVARSEATSIGCHTDLWEPDAGRWSSLAPALGIADLFPPFAKAFDRLDTLRPEIAAATGLDPRTQVICGIHDSNASLVPHLLARPAPFTVVSTGTWVVLLSVGASIDRLDPTADMLANVDATGRAVACAKFMGGREFAAIAGDAPAAGLDDLAAVAAAGALALPCFSGEGGPYAAREGEIRGTLPDRPAARSALAALYAALMTDDLLTRLGAEAGPLVVEGGFANSPAFAAALAALRPGQPVEVAPNAAGTAQGAALLAHWPKPAPAAAIPVATPALPGLATVREAWRAALA